MEGISLQSEVPASFQQFSCLPNKTELSNCFLDCPNNTALNKFLERIVEDEELTGLSTFWFYGLLVILAFSSMAVTNSMSDALCFQVLGGYPIHGHDMI
jgi:hypothetical protein